MRFKTYSQRRGCGSKRTRNVADAVQTRNVADSVQTIDGYSLFIFIIIFFYPGLMDCPCLPPPAHKWPVLDGYSATPGGCGEVAITFVRAWGCCKCICPNGDVSASAFVHGDVASAFC